MARKPPMFAKATLVSNRFPEFAAMIREARREALTAAASRARTSARAGYAAHRVTPAGQSPTTLQTINARTDGESGVIVYVGTLRGVMKEYGTKEREGPRGAQEAHPYLRPAADEAREMILPAMAARLPH